MKAASPAPGIQTLAADVLHRYGQGQVGVRRIVNQEDISPHNHVFHELVYVEAGSAEHETAAGRQTLHPGDLIVIRPLVWHAYSQTRNLTLLNCLFEDRLIRRFADLLRDVPDLWNCIAGAAPICRRIPPSCCIVLHLGARLCFPVSNRS